MGVPNPPYETQLLPYGEAAIATAARLIAAGEPVAMPTETVYGLAADAGNGRAVARIYEAKGRPSFNPLIVHVRDLAQAEEHAHFPEAARRVAEAWWPGALTLVLPRREESRIAPLATAGLDTIALRCPRHPAMQDLIAAAGIPLAAPSANASGGISPTSANHVLRTLDGRIPLVVDGGRSSAGLESTIVRIDGGCISLLRPGPVSFEEVIERSALTLAAAGQEVRAPGQLLSHYAPSKPLRLQADAAEPGEWMVGYGGLPGDDNLSPSGDLVEAAARLFDALHRADASEAPRIAVAPIPERGIGMAINDRLRRAAAPRP